MGLAIVAQSQVSDMINIQSLQGGEGDAKILDMLVKNVQDAMTQNQMNLKMANSQCPK
jgi:hypothetical protein